MRFTLTVFLAASLFVAGCDTGQSGCTDDYDCKDDRVCRLADGLCEQKICKTDGECAGDAMVCQDNRCLNTCLVETDCGSGFRCEEGVCTP